ncbi:ethanolamine ammonia-lyase subunit EutB [Mangrovicoccus ximenensis]|uniref:ethanolamine ammonia-lyase subunit EutB n=1 Tax=Mangrovicoccus ximenensis TaxID=1911570 RepID=UPI001F1AEF4C|nr:ethanolamine ammonia-lyase subunit EutB [Mangrovicoccus ximenensis]
MSKLMRNQDLIGVAQKIEVVSRFRTTLGLKGRLATRLQPNHPADDPAGIAVAVLDGLLQGAGDAVIGINPASDSIPNCTRLVEALDRLRLEFAMPVQSCVLTHVTNTIRMIEAGAPVDLPFQSIAGTEAANRGFGVDLAVLGEANDAARSLNRGTAGNNVMYFETGQGAPLSADAHHGVDQQTLEVRAYGVARAFDPFLVNTVVGFIGPEYLYDGKQVIRAGLEDHFCAKLLGLPMGCDVCYTNHVEADQDDMDTLMTLLAVAGVNFVICVPGADDVMLSYQTLSFEDGAWLRTTMGKRPAPEFEDWLAGMDLAAGPLALPDLARRMGIPA